MQVRAARSRIDINRVRRPNQSEMTCPAEIDPEFSPEDWALIDQFEAQVEGYFESDPGSDYVTFTTDRDPRYAWRHWNEVVRRTRASGWQVTPKHSGLLVQRPPLGSGETLVRFRTGTAESNIVALVDLVAGAPITAASDSVWTTADSNAS